MSERTRTQALSEVTSDAERAARNETAMRLNITECPSTPVFPPLLGNPDILPHGEVRCIISHMPWEPRKLLYCIVWKPYDVDVVPILWWVKFSALVYHYALVNDYHYLHRIDPPPWPKKQYPRLTACLGVREIMRALEERKAYLIVHGFSDEEAAREVTNERWRMRDEWQQTGRGWGSAKEIVQKRRKEWIEGEHFMKHWRDEIDEMIESNTPTDQPLQEGTAGVSKQCSEHILRHGSSQRGQTGSGASKKQFDTRDELEWREIFAEMLARGKTALPPQKGHLLQSQRSNNSQPLSRVVSTLKRDSKRPNSQQGYNTHEETVPSLGDPVIISGSNETTSLDTVRLRSHSFGNKLFSGMFRKLSWRHYPSPTSSPHHSRPCTPCKSAGCNYSNTGASQATTEHEPQCNCLDGASKSEEEAQSHVNSPGITAVDLVGG